MKTVQEEGTIQDPIKMACNCNATAVAVRSVWPGGIGYHISCQVCGAAIVLEHDWKKLGDATFERI